jgi:hypothetical protein
VLDPDYLHAAPKLQFAGCISGLRLELLKQKASASPDNFMFPKAGRVMHSGFCFARAMHSTGKSKAPTSCPHEIHS